MSIRIIKGLVSFSAVILWLVFFYPKLVLVVKSNLYNNKLCRKPVYYSIVNFDTRFGLTKEGLQSNSFRFIAIDEAFKAQDEDKARYLISLCKQLHLQLLVVTPSDNIHIVENDISFVHFVERKEERHSWLYDMPIEQFKEEKANYLTQ